MFVLCGVLLGLFWPATTPAAELGDARCYRCHKDLQPRFSRGRAHQPVQEGDCFACHDAHGAARELRLLAAVPELCLECHDTPGDSPHPHAPVADGDCLACHNPHNSEHPALLTEAVPTLCAECHDEKVEPGFGHSQDCFACHDAHGTDYPNLLAGTYPRQRRARFSEESYALCFRCHPAEAITEPAADAPTAFRSQQQNLHYLHIIGAEPRNPYSMQAARPVKPGITCGGCHQVHGSEQPKAVRTSYVQNGFTVYNMRFTRSDHEGGCVVGCHKEERYQRSVGADISAGTESRAAEGWN